MSGKPISWESYEAADGRNPIFHTLPGSRGTAFFGWQVPGYEYLKCHRCTYHWYTADKDDGRFLPQYDVGRMVGGSDGAAASRVALVFSAKWRYAWMPATLAFVGVVHPSCLPLPPLCSRCTVLYYGGRLGQWSDFAAFMDARARVLDADSWEVRTAQALVNVKVGICV